MDFVCIRFHLLQILFYDHYFGISKSLLLKQQWKLIVGPPPFVKNVADNEHDCTALFLLKYQYWNILRRVIVCVGDISLLLIIFFFYYFIYFFSIFFFFFIFKKNYYKKFKFIYVFIDLSLVFLYILWMKIIRLTHPIYFPPLPFPPLSISDMQNIGQEDTCQIVCSDM